VDFYSAIAMSCDVFFYQAGQRIGPDRMAEYAKDFGLAAKTGIDLPREDIGTVPNPTWKQKHFAKDGAEFATWYGGDTLHMSIGQGDVLVTPLQMALSTAAIANGGDVYRPFLTDRVKNAVTGVIVSQTTPSITRHVPISADNLEDVRRAMRQTVTNGTGKVVLFPEVATAAKTGSAQVHGSDKTHGWFICFAPVDHPTIAIAAIVEHGGHGADSAGLIARAMLLQHFHLKSGSGQMSKSD
jgi:penicillin-binding protein 2